MGEGNKKHAYYIHNHKQSLLYTVDHNFSQSVKSIKITYTSLCCYNESFTPLFSYFFRLSLLILFFFSEINKYLICYSNANGCACPKCFLERAIFSTTEFKVSEDNNEELLLPNQSH